MTADTGDGGLNSETAKAPIVTRRLLLRRPTIADIPAISRLINDPLIGRNNTAVPFPYTPIEGWRFLRYVQAGPPQGVVSGNFLVTLRGNPRHIVGGAGFRWHRSGPPELGCWIAAAHRRRGFASEATRALLARIFTAEPSIEAVCAAARVDNIASQRVLRRAGFRRSGVGKIRSRSQRRYVPVTLFRISRAEWNRRSQRGSSQP
jgi:RimJ/RimL family protein N-acetyltransferase